MQPPELMQLDKRQVLVFQEKEVLSLSSWASLRLEKAVGLEVRLDQSKRRHRHLTMSRVKAFPEAQLRLPRLDTISKDE